MSQIFGLKTPALPRVTIGCPIGLGAAATGEETDGEAEESVGKEDDGVGEFVVDDGEEGELNWVDALGHVTGDGGTWLGVCMWVSKGGLELMGWAEIELSGGWV